ncbi:MAG: YkvA family protein [Aeromonas sp.]
MESHVDKYSKPEDFNEGSFIDKLLKFAKQIGQPLIEKCLQLYYATQRSDIPTHIKMGIYSALAYVVLPLDFIPDILPVVGYSDDAAAVIAIYKLASDYIDERVVQQAKDKFTALFA